MILQLTLAGGVVKRVRLGRKPLTIGSAANSSIRVHAANVPERLCHMSLDPGGEAWCVRIADDAPRLPGESHLLRPGRALGLGPLILSLVAEPSEAVRECPGCHARVTESAAVCVTCGFDFRAGRFIGGVAQHGSLTPPPVDDPPPGAVARAMRALDEAPEPGRFEPRARLLPVMKPTLCAVAALIALAAYVQIQPPDEPLRFALGMTLSLVIQTATLFGCLLLANRFGAVDLGDAHQDLYKCATIVVVTLACVLWTPILTSSAIGGPGGLPPGLIMSRFVQSTGALLSLIASMLVPLILVKLFFELDFYEWMIVSVVQCGATVLILFVAMQLV
jgi:hypothetical protein